ncbi:hypothetical protein Esi_0141_0029 [Ectocarpus siliculosus]|uniref:Uncharacterized protein n=1 Tax=Ectocarpus siliculosus TaxID=2880 RepID=D8LF48_ECTSI|nr:hypothetical protein Esi_0141_0029 [Ectocarpus siliculosus]|eukprot:CBN78646.1 hypothetical protein Esi_0141_0029 [Ectocarpus siliculosus]
MGGASGDLCSTSAGGTGIGHQGGGGGNKSSSRGGGGDGPGVPRRRRGLSWMAQTCSTATRSFDWWGAASDPSDAILVAANAVVEKMSSDEEFSDGQSAHHTVHCEQRQT